MQALLAHPREDIDPATVRAALAFDHAPLIRHGVDVLDSTDKPVDGEELRFEGGSVSWSYRPPDRVTGASTSVAEVRRRAELVVPGPISINLNTRRLRPWSDFLAPDGTWVRFHRGVFVATIPGADDDGLVVRRTLHLADKTYRYKTRELTEPIVVPAGTNQVDYVKADLTARFGETSFAFASSTVTLAEDRVFEPPLSFLGFYNALFESAGHDQLTVTANGRPRAVPLSDLAGMGAETTYGPGAGRIITAGGLEPLLPTLPNVVRFVARQGPSLPEEGNGIRTKYNQSTGPASIDERGEQVEQRVQVEAENQAELDAIADADAGRYFAGGGLRFTGKVALNPLHDDRDVVELLKPRLGLSGVWHVTSWTSPLNPITSPEAVTMPITLEKRVA